jgi:chromate transport protein ChrA
VKRYIGIFLAVMTGVLVFAAEIGAMNLFGDFVRAVGNKSTVGGIVVLVVALILILVVSWVISRKRKS